jgi:hypothetical protein
MQAPGSFASIAASKEATNEGAEGDAPRDRLLSGGQVRGSIDMTVKNASVRARNLHSRIEERYTFEQEASDEDEDAPIPQIDGPNMYISRLFAQDAKTDSNTKSLLWDSGATQHVFGKGAMQERLRKNLLVVNEAPWIEKDYQHRKVNPREYKHINVIVANGQSVSGEQVPQIDVEVVGETLHSDGSKKQGIKKTMLTMYDVVSTAGINTCVISETHFMLSNPNVTLITQGQKKWLVWGKVKFTYEGIEGRDPVKVDLRYHNGAHYLDIGGAVQSTEKSSNTTGYKKEYNAYINTMRTDLEQGEEQTETPGVTENQGS